ncbi:MAG: glycosyltransferase family 2 protein [Candidatus Portnoybacteria bacterium]|nr:glycosyltransferase family 2 protein [Candidatus Portnoybacteria bacterium]
MIEVSIIIPCRNEENYIAQCLDSLAAQNYPKERLEVLVVDGLSEDGTRNKVKPYTKRYPFIKLLDNSSRIIPVAMNIGIKNAKGDVIMKMDAHASYPKDYVSKCVNALRQYDADNAGGMLITKPGGDTLQARAIALCLSHWFGVGSSPFRRQSQSKKPREVDTVAFGCYKKEVFKKIGLYNEHLERSSDMELNIRLKKAGGKILLVPDITAYYYADSTFTQFW